MSKRFFVDDRVTEDGKYRVLQEDSETKERFGVKDCETEEEAQRIALDMQGAIDHALSQKTTGELPEVPLFLENNSDVPQGNAQDLKDGAEE